MWGVACERRHSDNPVVNKIRTMGRRGGGYRGDGTTMNGGDRSSQKTTEVEHRQRYQSALMHAQDKAPPEVSE